MPTIDPAVPSYVPPDTFADLCASGRILAPVPADDLVDDDDLRTPSPDGPTPRGAAEDPLEAFCVAWGAAGISPAESLIPVR
jgi:hypothetical protein